MKTYTKESLIDALTGIKKRGWIPTGRKNNDGGVGNTLEDLLGIEENNLPLPDASSLVSGEITFPATGVFDISGFSG